MKISVRVKPNAKDNRIENTGRNQFAAWVNAKPRDGKANEAVVDVLADFLGVAKSRIVLLRGKTSRQKIFEVI